MSRRKGWMFFALGLILALSAGAMVFVVLQKQAIAAADAAKQAAQPLPTMKLPVAARSLEPGMTLSSADYVLKPFPLDLVPPSAISDTVALDNKVLARTVSQGETFQPSQFLGSQGGTLSQQIKPGNVLFAFPIVDLMSKSNLLHDGDHIDLLLTLPVKAADGQDTSKATGFTLQNIEVFKVLRPTAEDNKSAGDATALLCSLPPQDAVIIKSIKDSGGTIDFTLRSPADKEPFEASPINQTEMESRYKLK